MKIEVKRCTQRGSIIFNNGVEAAMYELYVDNQYITKSRFIVPFMDPADVEVFSPHYALLIKDKYQDYYKKIDSTVSVAKFIKSLILNPIETPIESMAGGQDLLLTAAGIPRKTLDNGLLVIAYNHELIKNPSYFGLDWRE